MPPTLPASAALHASTFVAIDFETATARPDSACAIGVVRVQRGRIVHRKSYLLRPPSREFEFTPLHGLTWQDVKAAPTLGQLWGTLAPLLEGASFLAAHNAGFDRRVLEASCARWGVKAPELPFVCTVELARARWNLRPTKLPDVARHLGLALRHHDPLSDAEVCAQIVLASTGVTAVRRGSPPAAP